MCTCVCCFQSVIVKSIERNSRNMYLARLLLLGLHPEGLSGPLLKAATTNTHSSAGLGLTTLGNAPGLSWGAILLVTCCHHQHTQLSWSRPHHVG